MKGKDYSDNINIYDEEIDRLQEMLTNLDPLRDKEDYNTLNEQIKKLQESKLLEHKCYTEHKEHLIPEAFPKVLSTIVSAVLVSMIYNGESKGAVLASGATTLLSKVKI